MAPEESIDQRLRYGLGDPLPRRFIPTRYLVGLVGAAFAMLLLPLLYVTIVTLAGVGVYLALDAAAVLFQVLPPLAAGGLWLLIAAAGLALVFLLIHPLFFSVRYGDESVRIEPESAPALFRLVAEVSRVLNVPPPDEIRVSVEVNAHAEVRGGLFSRRRVVVFGLPIAAAFPIDAFAGVLAHELAHTAQGMGVRLGSFVRRTCVWFDRVVHGTEGAAVAVLRASGSRAGFRGVRAFLFIPRSILGVLRHIGLVVAAYLSRRMEYDADRCVYTLIGADPFAEGFRRLNVLEAAARAAYLELRQSFGDGRLVDDVPALIVKRAREMPAKVRREVLGAAREARTGALDSHPSEADRIERARASGETGQFEERASALLLLTDAAGLAREATARMYRRALGRYVETAAVLPSGEYEDRMIREDEAEAALESYAGVQVSPVRPLVIPVPAPIGDDEAEGALELLGRARASMLQEIEDYAEMLAAYERADSEIAAAAVGRRQTSTAFRDEEADVRRLLKGRRRIASVGDEWEEYREQLAEEMKAFENALRIRTKTALSLLTLREIAERAGLSERRVRESTELCRLTRLLPKVLTGIGRLRVEVDGLERAYKTSRGSSERAFAARGTVRSLARTVRRRLSRIHQELGDTVYPFAEDGQPLRHYVVPRLPAEDDAEGHLHAARGAIERLARLYFRTLGTLFCMAEAAERVTQTGEAEHGASAGDNA